MVNFKWQFPEMPPSMPNQEPMEREFFVDEPINTRIVRESIQNSLDAGINRRRDSNVQTPVRVRFALSGIQYPLPEERAVRYLAGLDEHLRSVNGLDSDIQRRLNSGRVADGDMPFIVIEDAGTVGLTGDWEQYDDTNLSSARDNHFYWFFRNVGRSAKTGNENGSWGLGKWVFPDASHANCYIAVTRRADDTLLIGQAVLSKHSINGHRYAPYGYLSVEGENGLALPLRRSEPEHRPYVDQCIDDFGLKFRNEPGLSIIVPFPKTEYAGEGEAIDTHTLLTAVVHNYFYPIVVGRLEVTVDGGNGEPEINLNADTIDEVVGALNLRDDGERSAEGYRHLFALSRQALELPLQSYTQLSAPPSATPSNDKSGNESRNVIKLRDRYENGEILAFNIATDVRRKGESGRHPTEFKVYLQRDDSLDAGHDFYVRGTLSITEIDLIGKRRARTLLVVDENEPLAAMLRDSEPPKHTTWRPQTDRVTRNWTAASRRIEAVRRSPNNLLSLLEAPPEGRQRDVFADIFPWSPEPGGQPNPSSKRGTPRVSPRRPLKIPPAFPDFSVTRSETGFRVTGAANARTPLEDGDTVRLRLAYEVSRGNPLNSYQKEDFRLLGPGALDVQVNGAVIQEGDGNRIDLLISGPQAFEVAVQGFDRRRDLHIRIEKIVGENAEATESADDP